MLITKGKCKQGLLQVLKKYAALRRCNARVVFGYHNRQAMQNVLNGLCTVENTPLSLFRRPNWKKFHCSNMHTLGLREVIYKDGLTIFNGLEC